MAKSLSSADIAFLSRINDSKRVVDQMPDSPSELANEKSLAQLERQYALLKAKTLAKQEALQYMFSNLHVDDSIFDARKPYDRLSGDNSARVLILIIPALFFDTAQLALGVLGLMPFLLPVVLLINYALLAVSFLVFFFIWQHFKVSFKEKYISKKGVLPVVLNIIRAMFPFLEVLPFFPGITLNVITSIIIVRQIDKLRRNKKRLQELEIEIEQRKLSFG